MSRKYVPAVVLLLTTAGFMLRLYRLDAVPLRGDEAFTVQNWMLLPLSESLSRIATIEPHPFFNYVLFRLWGLIAGGSEFSARYLPALVNTLGIPAIYVLSKRLRLNNRIAVLSAVFWTVHPFLIWHSQDARNYAIWSGLSIVSLWLGLMAVQHNQLRHWLLYALLAAVTANIFYFELFTTTAFATFVVIQYRKQAPIVYRMILVLLFVAFIAGLSFGLLQAGLVSSGGYGGTTGSGLQIDQLLLRFLPVLVFGETLPSLAVFIVPLAFLLIIALFVSFRVNRQVFFFAVLVAFLPVLLLSLASLRFDVFAPRYVLSVVPGFILLLTMLIDYLVFHARMFLSWMGIVLVFIVIILSLSSLWFGFVNDYAKSKDWPSITDYLEQYTSPDDLIIQLSVDPAFGFYYDGTAPDIGLPANPGQPNSEITSELETASHDYDSLWLVGQTFPDWPNYGVVEHWLNSHMQPVRRLTLADMPVYEYKRWEVTAGEIEDNTLAVFGDLAELAGERVLLPEPDALTVWLYWRTLAQTDTPYKVFVHLTGDINPTTNTPLWAQDDHYPQNGRISTTDWALAAIYRDVYVIPLHDVLPGDYTLRVGWYNPDTGERRLLPNGDDSYTLQTITLP